MGHPLALVVLALDGGVGGAAPHGEVVATDHDGAPVDFAAAEHEVRRRQLDEIVLRVVRSTPRDLADLVERAGISELGDALADGEASAVVLSLDALRPAELLRERLAAPQIVHFAFPAHGSTRGGPGFIPGPERGGRGGPAAGPPCDSVTWPHLAHVRCASEP